MSGICFREYTDNSKLRRFWVPLTRRTTNRNAAVRGHYINSVIYRGKTRSAIVFSSLGVRRQQTTRSGDFPRFIAARFLRVRRNFSLSSCKQMRWPDVTYFYGACSLGRGRLFIHKAGTRPLMGFGLHFLPFCSIPTPPLAWKEERSLEWEMRRRLLFSCCNCMGSKWKLLCP